MLQPWQWPLLFATGLAAGFVDAIAGGGGLITLPVLLGLGLAPRAALGTNKLQSSFGSASATWHYSRAGTVALRDCVRGFSCTFLGALLGVLAVQQLDPSLLRKIIPVMLGATALLVWLRPRLGEWDAHPRVPRGGFDVLAGLALGFYDGFFGPGTGTFWAMAFVLGLGFNLTKATGYTKVMNFASNAASLMLFAALGHVVLAAGLVMGAGQLLGARLGSQMVVKRGARFIRPIFLTVVLVITAKLIYDAYLRRPA
ncbi:MAG TPA: TSUP family transporter [Verrucomicrobiae bacterium]|nr:TSUP family transporter [Verrucomicrobiae bacterium]